MKFYLATHGFNDFYLVRCDKHTPDLNDKEVQEISETCYGKPVPIQCDVCSTQGNPTNSILQTYAEINRNNIDRTTHEGRHMWDTILMARELLKFRGQRK